MIDIDDELRKEFRKLEMRLLVKKIVSPDKLDALLQKYSKAK